MGFDVSKIRSDFPILKQTVYGKPLVYLDNAATTQKPQCVLDTIVDFYSTKNSNVHRGVHYLSEQATLAHEGARKTVMQFLNAKHDHEIIFTKGTTDSVNLVAYALGEAFVEAGDEIVISYMEHHSNLVPWKQLCQRKGASLKVIPFGEDGELDQEVFAKLLGPKVKLLAVAHVSNALGTVNPIKEMIAQAHALGIPVLIDAAQSIQHFAIDVQELDCEFLAFSGHKIYAPTGIGVLYGKDEWLNKLPPYQYGGEMIESVSFQETIYNQLPFKFEAGTPNYVGAAALATAIDYVQEIGLDSILEHENMLLQYATEQLLKIDELTIYGNAKHKASVISFMIGNSHSYDVGMMLDKMGIAVRTGTHCAQPVIDFFGLPGTVRASFAMYNTVDEVDQLVKALTRVARILS